MKLTSELQEKLIAFLKTGRNMGRTTCEIGDKFWLTNKQVGGIMGALKRKGIVFTYTKGTIVFSDGIHAKGGSPMRLSNSFYELKS